MEFRPYTIMLYQSHNYRRFVFKLMMHLSICCCFNITKVSCADDDTTKESVNILGLYPFTGWAVGDAILSASNMAVEQINANETLLRDYELVLIPRDSGVSSYYT